MLKFIDSLRLNACDFFAFVVRLRNSAIAPVGPVFLQGLFSYRACFPTGLVFLQALIFMTLP